MLSAPALYIRDLYVPRARETHEICVRVCQLRHPARRKLGSEVPTFCSCLQSESEKELIVCFVGNMANKISSISLCLKCSLQGTRHRKRVVLSTAGSLSTISGTGTQRRWRGRAFGGAGPRAARRQSCLWWESGLSWLPLRGVSYKHLKI